MRIAGSTMKKLYVFAFLVLGMSKPVKCHSENTIYAPSHLQENISVNCLRDDCSINATRYDYTRKSRIPERASLDPPLWCPDGYSLLNKNGKWFHLCRLQPPSLDIKGINVTTGSLTNSTIASLSPKSFSDRFEICPKLLLEKDQYEINFANGSLTNLATNYSVFLGNYYILGSAAVVCDDREELMTGKSKRVEIPVWCMPLEISKNDFRIESDGHLRVGSLQIFIPRDYYNAQSNNSNAHICVSMEPALVSCKRCMAMLDNHKFSVLPNMEVQLHKNVLKTCKYPLGRYLLAQDRSMLFYCPDLQEPYTNETLYIYGIVSLLSAFCLLLALVAHMFFPNLNYHTKSLLCLAFSLFVTYIAIAVKNFSGNFQPGAGNVVLFAIQYIFALGAFFWLNVLAFDLWRVFSKLQGTVNAGANKAKKRIFLAKCAYAWGIPTLLCSVIIGVSFSPKIQQALYVDFQFQNVSWFHESTSFAIFFYTPIIIILVENVIFFVLTIVNIKKASSGTDILHKKVSQKLFKVYMKLFLVMGICWIAEAISWFTQDLTQETTWYFTDIINSSQGVFIFLIYVCKRKTLRIIKNKIGYISNSGTSQTSITSHNKGKTAEISLTNLQKRNSSPVA